MSQRKYIALTLVTCKNKEETVLSNKQTRRGAGFLARERRMSSAPKWEAPEKNPNTAQPIAPVATTSTKKVIPVSNEDPAITRFRNNLFDGWSPKKD